MGEGLARIFGNHIRFQSRVQRTIQCNGVCSGLAANILLLLMNNPDVLKVVILIQGKGLLEH